MRRRARANTGRDSALLCRTRSRQGNLIPLERAQHLRVVPHEHGTTRLYTKRILVSFFEDTFVMVVNTRIRHQTTSTERVHTASEQNKGSANTVDACAISKTTISRLFKFLPRPNLTGYEPQFTAKAAMAVVPAFRGP